MNSYCQPVPVLFCILFRLFFYLFSLSPRDYSALALALSRSQSVALLRFSCWYMRRYVRKTNTICLLGIISEYIILILIQILWFTTHYKFIMLLIFLYIICTKYLFVYLLASIDICIPSNRILSDWDFFKRIKFHENNNNPLKVTLVGERGRNNWAKYTELN